MSNPILGTNLCTQIGILVNDIEKAVEDYAKFFGVEKPPIDITAEYEDTKMTYNGAPAMGRTKQAFFDIGENIQIELLEPDHEPSSWRCDLDKYGEGVHHIAFQVDGMKKSIKICEAYGMKLVQTGQWATGQYAYLDAKDSLKLTIELLSGLEDR